MRQHVAHVVNPPPLPAVVQNLGDGRLDALADVQDIMINKSPTRCLVAIGCPRSSRAAKLVDPLVGIGYRARARRQPVMNGH
jgi:hypothetical protein